jgi:hypothetical protein
MTSSSDRFPYEALRILSLTAAMVHGTPVIRKDADAGVLPEPGGNLVVGRVVQGVRIISGGGAVEVLKKFLRGDQARPQREKALIINRLTLGEPLVPMSPGVLSPKRRANV